MILEKRLKKSKVLGWRISYTKIQVLLNAMMINSLIILVQLDVNVQLGVNVQEQDVLA
ncbi:hypothetical protein BC2903_08220 [Bacillus cereus]|nr:hypothetical protein BCM0075_2218 [Bacillus cereus]GCF67003.1 hypothetical protein BC2903_08220 [Bacillus cereus]GIX56751.1 hypothetical protein BPADB04_17810 [Bacillus paranthracis]